MVTIRARYAILLIFPPRIIILADTSRQLGASVGASSRHSFPKC